jgi:hypothetical protein
MAPNKPRDWTGFLIVAGCLFFFGCVAFGIVLEILKFAALVKWLMT